LIEDEDRTERQRRGWIMAYRVLGDAGAVCRRFGVSRPTLRKWLRRYEQEGEAGLCARERRLGVKRLRNELRRLHDLRLSDATIHKVLARHGVSVLPT